ncbi:type II secretion system protein [Chromohalobacter sp. 296-RDG]|uniref:PilW family protein n=1 Tax=Chromohalobacter sp. 296-RDG TaxID=2994062 RepID=UPI0024685B91|nr:type II secretion system protein [Chromohalobacter sp. 296-RDG]
MNNQQRQSGFTLIEMMISMLLGLIILVGSVSAYQAISGLREQRDGVYQLQDELLYVHQSMARAVAMAKDVEVSEGGSVLTVTPAGAAPTGCRNSAHSDWVWRVDSSEEKASFDCNGRKVLTLSTPGVTGVAFDTSGICNDASTSCVRVTLNYATCRDLQDCTVRTLRYHLSSRYAVQSEGGEDAS